MGDEKEEKEEEKEEEVDCTLNSNNPTLKGGEKYVKKRIYQTLKSAKIDARSEL